MDDSVEDRVSLAEVLMLWFFVVSALAAPPIDGAFEPSISQAEIQRRVDAAVDVAAQDFNWAIRGIARGKIAESATWCSTLKLYTDATHVGVQCNEEPALTRRVDNSEGPLTIDGLTVTSVISLGNTTLDLNWETPNGARRNHYVFGSDDAFELTVRLVSDKLTQPLAFTIPYRRTAPSSGLR